MGKRTNRGLAKLSLPVPRLAKGDTPQARLALVRAAGGPHVFLATKGLQALAELPQLSARALVTAESWELQVAEMRIREKDGQVYAEVRVEVQRQDIEAFSAMQPVTVENELPSRTPAQDTAAVSGEQNQAWQTTGRDDAKERDILNDLLNQVGTKG